MSDPTRPPDPYTAGVPGFHPQTGAAQPVPEVPESTIIAQTELAEVQTEDKFIESVKKQSKMWDKMKESGGSIMKFLQFFDLLKPFMMFLIPFKPIIAEVSKILMITFLPIVKAMIPTFKDVAGWMKQIEPYAVMFGEFVALTGAWGGYLGVISTTWDFFWSGGFVDTVGEAWESFWTSDIWDTLTDAFNEFVSTITFGIVQPSGNGDSGRPCAGLQGAAWLACRALHGLSGLQEGGITRGPTMSMVGDNASGIEMIVPLEKAGEMGFGGGNNGMLEYKIEELISWQKRLYYQQQRASRGLRRNG